MGTNYLFVGAIGAGIVGAFAGLYFLRGKKANMKIYSNEEKFSKHRNFSGLFGEDGRIDENQSITGGNDSWLSKNKVERTPSTTDIVMKGIEGKKLVIIMVGFPGRGKTYISRKIARYLRWIDYRTRVFSIAKYRLDKLGMRNADFFDPSNSTNYQRRRDIIISVLEDAMRYLDRGGNVVIIDGTHTTRDRRDMIREEVQGKRGYDILWIESICDSEEIISRHSDELSESPDYIDRFDFEKRISYYKQSYEKIEYEEGSYIKVRLYTRFSLHLYFFAILSAFVTVE